MAAVVGGELALGTTRGYLVVLVGALVVGSVATAARMWRHNCFESRLAAIVLALVIGVGQVLAASVGSPGTGGTDWAPSAWAVTTLAMVVIGLVLADARQRPMRPSHPYAL
jgi:hypothetical protein